MTVIGTALSPTATRVLLLGGGELGRGLADAFQNLGLEVHAADRYPGAPAGQVAHREHVIDITDPAAVLELVAQIQPQYVVPEVEHTAVGALRQLEDAGSCTVVPTARACELTHDRASIRAAAEALGLPTTAMVEVQSHNDLVNAAVELGFPFILKPDVTASGRGHVLVTEESEISAAWEAASAVARNQILDEHGEPGSISMVAERFVDFDFELTMMAVRSIDPATGALATWFAEPIGHRHENAQLVEAWQPLAVPPAALENARSVAARISNELGGRGVYCIELFVAGDEVYFSAVSPRPADTAMLTQFTQRFSAFDLHARAILGLPIDVTLTSPGAAVLLHAQHQLDTVAFHGVAAAMGFAEVDVRLFGKPHAYPGRRMGLVAATAETVSEARDRATLAAAQIDIRAH